VYAPVGVNDREGIVGVPFVHAPPPSLSHLFVPLSRRLVPPRYIPQHKYASLPPQFSIPSFLPLLPPQPRRIPLPFGVAWIHYTNYIDDTSMGHEIGGALAAPIAPELFFMLPAVFSPARSPACLRARILRPQTFVSFFSFRAKEENNVALAVLIMMQMIVFQYSHEH